MKILIRHGHYLEGFQSKKDNLRVFMAKMGTDIIRYPSGMNGKKG
jgi:hypothetical protein